MPDQHQEPVRDPARRDSLSGERRESRAAREEGTTPRGADSPLGAGTAQGAEPPPSDDAAVASEPMTIQSLPDDPPPPGRQKTGDPPAV